MNAPPAIELRGLTKRFGDTLALDHVDLVVRPGAVFGFLGRNGAGKTTALRILSGLARPTEGTAHVLGHDVTGATDAVRAQIGFLPDVPGFYPWMTATELVEFAGRLFAIDRATLRERARSLLEMIASLRGRTTVFFSTHILADVERVCDTVAILDRGRVVANAPIAELKRRAAVDRLVMEVDGDPTALVSELRSRPWLRSLEQSDSQITLAVTDLKSAQRELPAAIAAAGLGLKRLEGAEQSLEDLFVELVRHAEQ